MPPPVDDPAWEDWVLGRGVGPSWQPTQQEGLAFVDAQPTRPGAAHDNEAWQAQVERSVADMHRHHGRGDYNEAFQAGRQMLLTQLRGEDPPRLRLAVATLHAQLALSSGDGQGAHRQRAAVLALQEAQVHHAQAMHATLKRNAEDVPAALPLIEREWLDPGAHKAVKDKDGGLPQ